VHYQLFIFKYDPNEYNLIYTIDYVKLRIIINYKWDFINVYIRQY